MKREAYKRPIRRCPDCFEYIWKHFKEDGDTYVDEHVCQEEDEHGQ